MAECEARQVDSMPHEERAEFYGMVLEKRGSEAVERLKSMASAAWHAKQENAQQASLL